MRIAAFLFPFVKGIQAQADCCAGQLSLSFIRRSDFVSIQDNQLYN